MSAVTSINPLVRQVEAPTALRELPGWLLWRYETHPGEPKPRKVPHYVGGGRRYGKQGGPEDRAKLTTFGVAREAAARQGYDGVGLAMLPDWGVTGLDFDYCVDASGNIPAEVLAIVGRTYCEYSPSHNGVRAFVVGNLGDHKSLKDATNDWGLEVFSSKGFLTFTGNALPICEMLDYVDHIAPADDGVKALCAARFGATRTGDTGALDFMETFEPPMGLRDEDIRELLSDLDASTGRDDWIKIGMAIHHETGGEGFDIWDEWSSDGYTYPGTEALQSQWDSFDRRDTTGRQITMRSVKKMSNIVRIAQGLQPRSFDLISRAAEEARIEAEGRPTDPDTFISTADYAGKYRIYGADEFTQRPPIRWMIKGVLPRDGELIVIYGAPGSGKSLCALDLTMALVRGEPWRGLKVNKARVVYVAAEGAEGVAQRLKAYSQHHGVKLGGLPIGIVADAPNLMVEEDATELVKSIINAGGGDVIVCDTWAQVTPGANENSGEDMGMALKHCRSIRQATGAIVILIAHTGKDASRGIRGWSGLNGAANTTLEVIRDDDSEARMLKITKQKDGRDDLTPWGFKLQDVLIGIDEDGDEINSPVVIETNTLVTPKSEKTKKGEEDVWTRNVLDYIATLEPHIGGMELPTLIDNVLDFMPGDTAARLPGLRAHMGDVVQAMTKGKNRSIHVANGYATFLV
ncbi:AAA domain containing protein [uncultured Caudovirales phage]|uniref:AAA domain containing protein n=1 Tax=uncultured Caudovirales phage TaxID=2100421 RepID=A0A6J5MDX3_9CAUD|nr:AAA domain containing protein [uncultured Caudovirales phage]